MLILKNESAHPLFLTVTRRHRKIGGLTVLFPASRRPSLCPLRAEGEAEFTSRKQRIDASQLLKRQSENVLTGRWVIFET
jgi:hypothetical protein